MAEEMEKRKEIDLLYVEDLYEKFITGDHKGVLAKMINSWDEDWAKVDIGFMQSKSKEDMDKRRLLCVQALFLAEASILFVAKGRDREQCEFYSILAAKGTNGAKLYRDVADLIMPESDMMCLSMRGRISYKVASLSIDDRRKALRRGFAFPTLSFDDAIKDLLAADAIESSLENDYFLAESYKGKGDGERARFYFNRVVERECETDKQFTMHAKAQDALETLEQYANRMRLRAELGIPSDEEEMMNLYDEDMIEEDWASLNQGSSENETSSEDEVKESAGTSKGTIKKNKVEEKKKKEPQVKKNNALARAQGGSEKVESKKRGGKDSSETAVVEKKKRPSRNVSRPNYIDDSDGDEEPVVKNAHNSELRAVKVKKGAGLSMNVSRSQSIDESEDGEGAAEESDGDGEPTVKKAKSAKKATVQPNLYESGEKSQMCTRCKNHPDTAAAYAVHIDRFHNTTLHKERIFLVCECGMQVRCQTYPEHRNEKCDGLKYSIHKIETPACVLCKKKKTCPRTAKGYCAHLKIHHKSNLNENRVYLVCECGLIIKNDRDNTSHSKKCDGRDFTIHQLD